ncbi:MAG: hypothetical protein SGPRY_012742 [Prymnesium sp.]
MESLTLTPIPSRGLTLPLPRLRLQHIMGSRFLLEVVPNKIHAASCVCKGSGLSSATAGRFAQFAVMAWDGFGNISNPELALFHISIAGLDSPITISATGKSLGDGRYTFRYQANVAGRYEVHVRVSEQPDGEPIPVQGSPFIASVKPDVTCARMCAVRSEGGVGREGDDDFKRTAGDRIRLWVVARDRFFNPRPCGGDRFELQLMPEGGRGRGRGGGGSHVTLGVVTDNGDGTYAASVSTSTAGLYKLLMVLMPEEERPRVVDDSLSQSLKLALEEGGGEVEIPLSVTRRDSAYGLGPGPLISSRRSSLARVMARRISNDLRRKSLEISKAERERDAAQAAEKRRVERRMRVLALEMREGGSGVEGSGREVRGLLWGSLDGSALWREATCWPIGYTP